MNYRLKENILEISIVILFLVTTVYLLSFVYPYPYFLTGSFSGGAAYDGEPDYFSNIVSSFVNGHSMDYIHPGITITFLCKSILGLFKDVYIVQEIISSSRALLVFINFLMVYVGSRIVLRQKLSNFLLLLSLFIIFPAGFVLVDHLSPNGILFGLSVLVIALGYKLEEYPVLYLILFSIFLGFAVATKFPAIVLGFPFYLALLLGRNESDQHFITRLILSLVVFALSFSIFVWPVLPFLPFIFTHHNYSYSDFEFIFSNLSISLILIVLIMGILFYLVAKFRSITKIKYKKLYKIICIIFVSFLGIIILIKALSSNDYLSFSYSLRNSIPLLGMSVLFINFFIPKKISESSFNLPIFFIFFLSIFSTKIYYNQISENKALKFDESFSNLYSLYIHKYNNLVLYPSGSFASKSNFLAWADYRFGDSRYLFLEQEEKLPFTISEYQKKIRVLNTRKFDLENPKNKTSYQYFQSTINKSYLSRSQKGVALNQMNLQKPKELCTQVFDGYTKGSSALIVVPSSLHSYIFNNGMQDPDLAYDYVNALNNRLLNECKLDTEIKAIIHDTQKFYLLSIL